MTVKELISKERGVVDIEIYPEFDDPNYPSPAQIGWEFDCPCCNKTSNNEYGDFDEDVGDTIKCQHCQSCFVILKNYTNEVDKLAVSYKYSVRIVEYLERKQK